MATRARFPSTAQHMVLWRHRQSVDKYRAQQVHLLHERWHMRGKLLPRHVWYEAVKAHPPQRRPAPSIRANAVDANSDAERWQAAQEYCHGLGTHKWLKYHRAGGRQWTAAVREAAAIHQFPEEIRFPEDRLRARFLRDHPLERLRPLVMKERPSSSMDADSAATIAREQVVDVESLVRYQAQLMSAGGDGNTGVTSMSEEEAYRHACRAFYENRAKELARRSTAAASDSKKNDSQPDAANPWLQKWLAMEEEALQRGLDQKVKDLVQRRESESARRSATAM